MKYEIVIYGGTPAGISSAISSARLNKKVIIVEPNSHIGGMMTSGLGKCDIEEKKLAGGIFLEYVKNVYNYYKNKYGIDSTNLKLCKNGYYSEPSVSEYILEKMLKVEKNIEVYKDWHLNTVNENNLKLKYITIKNTKSNSIKEIYGDIFIDASYEGDLYSKCNIKYRVGRESKTEYNEKHAGEIYYDYNSKTILEGTTGKGDNRLPAYTYRLCLSTNKNNSIKINKPPFDYTRENYLEYFNDLKFGRLSGPKVYKPGRGYNKDHFDTMFRALSVTNIPNYKTDVNINPRPLGFIFAEENSDYIYGDSKQRQKICLKIKNLTLGLLWFLQNDPEIPKEHKIIANKYNLPLDEFIDNEHFPFQLYIREGRRLVGEYTLTENDVTKQNNIKYKKFNDNIAVGEFPIDSFPCQKKQNNNNQVLEGYLCMLDHITIPYEIPFRIMLPQNYNDLIVPVAASTSHIAFSSIRMEPTWMALGQAAGTAASLALDNNISMKDLPIDLLQKSLLKQNQVINL